MFNILFHLENDGFSIQCDKFPVYFTQAEKTSDSDCQLQDLGKYKFGELLICFCDVNSEEFLSYMKHEDELCLHSPASIITGGLTSLNWFEQSQYRRYTHFADIYNPTISLFLLNFYEMRDLIEIDIQTKKGKAHGDIWEIRFQLMQSKFEYVQKQAMNSGLYKEDSPTAPKKQSMEVTLEFTKENGIIPTYNLYDIDSLVALELLYLQNSGKVIKICQNCGRAFIPENRTDEIYCNRIFKNRKTCKDVGYIEKSKKDPFQTLYTKERKTQHARIRYNAHIKDYDEKHYLPWKEAAEKARDEFSAADDLEGFEKWIADHRNSF